MTPTSYLSPKLEARWGPEGRAVFAREAVAAGEVLALWGGEVMARAAFEGLPPGLRSVSVQVEDDLYLVPSVEGPAEWVNHSCAPNAGMSGQVALVALRPIAAGEEVCYDYAMSDGSAYDEFVCRCGAAPCRHRVTGDDWRLPALWARYEGHFSPYLQRRIDALRAGGAPSGRAVRLRRIGGR